jgi:hypothetical protein
LTPAKFLGKRINRKLVEYSPKAKDCKWFSWMIQVGESNGDYRRRGDRNLKKRGDERTFPLFLFFMRLT